MIMLIAYFIFVHITLLVPGYALVKNLRILAGRPGIELCAAYTVSILCTAALAVAGYTLDIPSVVLSAVHWVALGAGAVVFVWQKLYKDLAVYRFPLLALLLMTIFTTAFIQLTISGPRQYVPDPKPVAGNNYEAFTVKILNVAQTPANDNYIPYRQAQFMVNRSDPAKDSFIDEWGVHFFQRTPLLGAVAAQYFHLLGDKPPIGYTWNADSPDAEKTYAKFQIIGHIMNALFVLPAFFLLTKLFNRRTAQTALLFIIPSQFFLFNSFFTWPKSLVAFFILFSWLLLLERRFRYVILAGLASGAAYLAHDLAVLYIAASGFLLLSMRRFRDLFVFGALHLLFMIPWMFVSSVLYKKPSSFIYYPFSLHDIPQASKKGEILHEFFHTSPLRIIAIKIESLLYLLTPYQLFTSEGGQAVGRRLWASSLFNVPGAAGIGLIIPMMLGAIKKIRDLHFWIMALVPIIMCVFIIGWPKGLGALHFAEASVVLFVGLGVWWLLLRRRMVWLWIAFVLNMAQAVYFGLYSYNFHVGAWDSARNLVLLAAMGGIMTLCAAGVHMVARKKSMTALLVRLRP